MTATPKDLVLGFTRWIRGAGMFILERSCRVRQSASPSAEFPIAGRAARQARHESNGKRSTGRTALLEGRIRPLLLSTWDRRGRRRLNSQAPAPDRPGEGPTKTVEAPKASRRKYSLNLSGGRFPPAKSPIRCNWPEMG